MLPFKITYHFIIVWIVTNIDDMKNSFSSFSNSKADAVWIVKSWIVNFCVLVTQSYPTLCNPMNWSTSGSNVQGIL